jgi:nucleoside-diphosphate-sugar epimerase
VNRDANQIQQAIQPTDNSAGCDVKKALVTGASGFIGKALCVALRNRGWNVTAAMRSRGELNSADETVTVGSMDGGTNWRTALAGIDVVIHLAARVHVMNETAHDPLSEFRKINVDGTASLAVQAARMGVKRLLYVSSIKVNGEETKGQHTYTESDAAAPQDPYGVSKWEAEQALHQVSHQTGLEIVVVRPPLVYGPGVKGNFISLLDAVHKGLPLPLEGARNSRSLVYVGNLVDALITCAVHPAAAGKTYLVSDGQDVSTVELVRLIAGALGGRSRLIYVPPSLLRGVATLLGRRGAFDRLFGSLCVDSGKLRKELDWRPPYTMARGLGETAAWYLASKR